MTEETLRRRWAAFEPMRIRIMQEAYDCADRDEVEAYNSIKVLCSEVLELAERLVLAEREACAKLCEDKVDAEYATGKVDHNEMGWTQACAIDIRARGEK